MLPTVRERGEVYHNVKAKRYPDGHEKILACSRPIFKDECYEPIDKPKVIIPKPKNLDSESRYDNVKRARERVYDIAALNSFQWFITWTLDKEKIDRYDSKEVSRTLKQFLNNRVKRNDARYLVIPEHHKDGAIHMHGLLSGNFQMEESRHKLKDGRMIYNMPQWKLGWSTAIELDNQRERYSRYITKYVTKDFAKIFGNYYYAGGHGLVREPKIELYDANFYDLPGMIYKPEAVAMGFKYISMEGAE